MSTAVTTAPPVRRGGRAGRAAAVLLLVPLALAACSASIETGDDGKAERSGAPTAPAAAEPDEAASDGSSADADGEVAAGGSGAAGNPFVGRSDLPVLNSTCTGQDLDVDEDGSTVIMTGPCGAITVTASWVTVNVDDVERLEVAGDNVTVIAKDVGAVVVSGSGNLLNLDRVADGVEDTGRLNEILTD